jgi:hypothetical protein
MKNLKLNFAQRLKASNILGLASGNLEKILPLSTALEAIRFDDAELKQIKIVNAGNGLMSYEAPNGEFGAKEVGLEDAHAAAVLRELEAFQGYSVADVVWLTDLKKQLGG